MSSSKRQSLAPRSTQSGPKAPVNFSSSLIIADTAVLTGNHTINISTESVIHPRAKLDSSNGRITVSRRCIVHERTNIGAASADPTPSEKKDGVFIHDYVTIETGVVIESGGTYIHDGTHVGVGSKIGKGATIGKYCTITAQSVIPPWEEIPDYTVVYSNGMRRPDKRGVDELKKRAQTRQIEVLRRLIASNPAKFQS